LTFLEIALSLLCIIFLVSIVWLARNLYRMGVLVLKVQDTLEDSLEIIDERIESVDSILAIPLFSDSPEIKRLQRDMTECRDAVLDIAYSLSDSLRSEEEQTPGDQF